MTTINRKLKITLKSDLCVASGFAYAGIIDADVSYDKNGIPYISGRRIKGCLKESANLLGFSNTDKELIFGKRGEDCISGICIGNAYPENYDYIYEGICELQKEESELSEYVNAQDILDLYTNVRAQTGIATKDDVADNSSSNYIFEGVAKEGSLRFTRVINQFDPISSEEMVFTTTISYEYENEDLVFKKLKMLIKATRNIGLNRNRGFGSVKMEMAGLANVNDAGGSEKNENSCNDKKNEKNNNLLNIGTEPVNYKRITYCIQNLLPLVIANNKDEKSENYIRGTNIIGMLAGEYLKSQGNASDQEFTDLFLSGETIFSDLTMTEKVSKAEKVSEAEKDDWLTFYPAPLYFNCLKKSKKLVNVAFREEMNRLSEESPDNDYSVKGGNQPKKLKNKYISRVDKYMSQTGGEQETYVIDSVEKTLIYHHTKYDTADKKEQQNKEKDNKEKGQLYYLEAIEEKQFFKGNIIVEEKYCELVLKLLLNAKIRLGKSKSAQYGECKLLPETIDVDDYTNPAIKLQQDVNGRKHILVTLISDGLFLDENGNYTVQHEVVRDIIRRQIIGKFPKDHKDRKETIDKENRFGTEKDNYTFIQTGEVNGYNSKWNLRKQSLPMIKAGSAFEYILDGDVSEFEYSEYVGERNLEGFGHCMIYDLNASKYQIREIMLKDLKKINQKNSDEEIKSDIENNEGVVKNNITNSAEVLSDNKENNIHDSEEVVESKENSVNHIEKIMENSYIKALIKKIITKKYSQSLKSKVFDVKKIDISDSALGRLMLMIIETENKHPNEPLEQYRELYERIKSIKSNETRDNIEKFVQSIIGDNYIKEVEQKMDREYKRKLREIYNNIKKSDDAGKYEEAQKLRKRICDETEKMLEKYYREKQTEYICSKLSEADIRCKSDGQQFTNNHLHEDENNEENYQREYAILLKYYEKEEADSIALSLWLEYLKNLLINQKYI